MRSTSAVEHPRRTEKPPGTPSGRNSERLLWRMKRGISTAAVRERENSASRSVSGERQRGYQRLDDVWSVYSPFSRGSLTREREGGGCKNFSFTVLRLFFWLQKKRGKLRRGDGSAEEYCEAQVCAPFTLVLVCTSVQTAASRYLSLSQALKS